MADINIVQQHKLTAEKARQAAQQVADKLAQEYDLACAWDGDVLRFERSGVDGSLTLEKEQAQLQIKLGFMLSAFASTIEGKIAEKMRKVFTEPA
ncbi:polyhydroxyalkanoic acid system family protein [Janthinobacterium lividum]|jgi:putative polyhydroxyalkanoate system protein|uniref:Polyhydroxyalkanoic acid system family protein n=1 Tax=Janthinobacterium lividum TaxID=29581 RepID=A0AAJ4MUN7_9BURK|nr:MULTISPECIES: polyhydroxyalkanoic acid system family protein [Janthinobacterium]KAB0331368.1 polyhydroxyalkanoic acid system protein [Janthinobacterium lividum]MBR7636188.1 polyhydroxyalkanoic acid system family protein [Janthinobacterium lividum]MCC7714769.1 polyhydroxyalkanoic acid system family protein [Janthinobacterium lividum]MDO8036157.1 polyhydroxyalkanoic acid system family protein [Janthinobacterium sp. SUN128]OEZ48312.1 putative polyhydroxyalkanoic acid system protein (PHA_gran_r